MNNTATSYKIRGIAPSDLAGEPPSVRKMYWQWVVEYGLARKDRELAQGLDKDGKPLRPISPKTRKYRRSAMTPTGKGDPNAPPLTPAHAKSRTRSLLAGRALTTHAEFFWRFDPFTGDQWGVILAIQANEYGRDVRGLSPAGIAWVERQALRRWNAWKKQGRPLQAAPPPAKKPGIPTVGSYSTEHATFGIGVSGPEKFAKGQWTGGMTWPEWRKHMTASAQASVPGRPSPRSAPHPTVGAGHNRLLRHIWGARSPRVPVAAAAAAGLPPKKPKPAFDWSSVTDPSLTRYRVARAVAARQRAKRLGDIARDLGITEAEAATRLAAALESAVRSSEVYIRVDEKDFVNVLIGGRFKTQFETGRSYGAFVPEIRRAAEEAVFGTPRSIAPRLRPVYGYASAPDFADFRSANEAILLGYGDVAVKLKPSVRARTTFTVGDSLGLTDRAQGARLDAPSISGFPLVYQHQIDLARRLIRKAKADSGRRQLEKIQADVSYLELQYHGGLSVDDIAEVAFRSQPSATMQAALAARGIPWRVIR